MMHCFRPAFLAKVQPPSYFEPYAFDHTCLQSDLSELIEDMDSLTMGDDENLDLLSQKRCLAAPYVSPSHFLATSIFEKLQAIVIEVIAHASLLYDHLFCTNFTFVIWHTHPSFMS